MENFSKNSKDFGKKENDFIALFPQIEKAEVGQKLGEGMGHLVYAYGSDQVLKIPKRSVKPAQKLEEYQVIQNYFPSILLQTEVLRDFTGEHYVLLQRRLHEFHNLTPENILEIQDQFDEVLRVNRVLVTEQNTSLDFLGKEGMTHSVKAYFSRDTQPEISNLVIERTNGQARLVLPDFSLLKFGEITSQDIESRKGQLISKITFRLNRRIILDAFGVDIA